jgi:hypothetical protein
LRAGVSSNLSNRAAKCCILPLLARQNAGQDGNRLLQHQSKVHFAMKSFAMILTIFVAAPALASEPAVAPPAQVVSPAAAAKFTLDTPVETLVANPATKTVLEENLPGITTHPQYETFKSMSLSVLAGFAPEKLTPERLAAVAAALAKVP